MEILIPAPAGFSFTRTAISHGWSDLPPFEIDLKNWTITRVIDLGPDSAVTVKISPADGGLEVATSRKLGKRAAQKVVRDVTHIFRLDDDMAAFYNLVAGEPDFAWISKAGAGRLLQGATIPLRSPYPERPWAFQSAWIAGLTNWEPDDVSYLLQHGHRPDGYRPRPPMPTFRMTKTDADAVVAYLTSLADAQAGSTVD